MPPHGSLSRYCIHGCRCDQCRASRAAYMREYRADPEKRARDRAWSQAWKNANRERNRARDREYDAYGATVRPESPFDRIMRNAVC